MKLNPYLFAFCCSLLAAFCLCPLNAEKPNIIIVMADDVGSDAIGCYGGQSHPTPHIDALAAGGMQFLHGYSMPVCHPTRICLMTGRYPFRFCPECGAPFASDDEIVIELPFEV